MTRYFSIDDATDALREIEPILRDLRDERAELIRLRDAALAPTPDDRTGTGLLAADPPEEAPAVPPIAELVGDEVRLLRLRMQGLIDRMQAGVARIDALGVTLREIETGLIDFPALVSGRPVWLCWRLDEPGVLFWHAQDEGFAQRRPISEL